MRADPDTTHAAIIASNRAKAPRAEKLVDALFDMALTHGRRALETLAIQVDGDFVQVGREISEEEWRRVYYAAVAALCAEEA